MAVFATFTPNFHTIVHSDFMRRTYENARFYGYRLGQIRDRANMTLSNNENTANVENLGHVRSSSSTTHGNHQDNLEDRIWTEVVNVSGTNVTYIRVRPVYTESK
jgi:hypothetical protein